MGLRHTKKLASGDKCFQFLANVLFKMLLNIVLDYIYKNANKRAQNLNVSILTNNLDAISKQIIIEIAKRVKHLNIVTNKQNAEL